jgi:hypothetical protein
VSQLSGVSSMAEAPRRPVRPVRRAREDFMVYRFFVWIFVSDSLVGSWEVVG